MNSWRPTSHIGWRCSLVVLLVALALTGCAQRTVHPPPEHPTITPSPQADATATPTARPQATTTSSQPHLARSATLVLMGDSWARQLGPALEPALRDRGFAGQFINAGVGGSTLAHWLSDADGRWTRTLQAVAAAEGKVLWLIFLGGNDLVDGYPAAGPAIFSTIEADWRTLLDHITAATPAATLVIGSYDYFPALCQPQLSRVNLNTPEAANQTLLALDDIYFTLSVDYANVAYIPLWGTLPGTGDATTARAHQWSDNTYYANCIHPNAAGFLILAERLAQALGEQP